VTEPDLRRLRELAAQACALARLHDLRRVSDTEYVDQLNELRSKHGLLPIRRQGRQERRVRVCREKDVMDTTPFLVLSVGWQSACSLRRQMHLCSAVESLHTKPNFRRRKSVI
jgi:hypothetical protein